MNNDFPNILRKLLKRDGLKQKDIAEEFNVVPAAVSNWACGKTQPSLETLIELSYFFEVTVDELIKGE